MKSEKYRMGVIQGVISDVLINGKVVKSEKDTTKTLYNNEIQMGFFKGEFSGEIVIPSNLYIYTIDDDGKSKMVYSRAINKHFALAEAAYILSGRDDAVLAYDFQFMEKYAVDGIMIGSYGPYFKEQISSAVENLKQNKNTRQAVVSVWPIYDDYRRSYKCVDVPCTNLFVFYSNDGVHLNMHVVHRSSDALVGLMYDSVFQHILLYIVAIITNFKIGYITNYAVNRHIYIGDNGVSSISEDDLDKLEEFNFCILGSVIFNIDEFIVKEVIYKSEYTSQVDYHSEIKKYISSQINDYAPFDIIADIMNALYKAVINKSVDKYIIKN